MRQVDEALKWYNEALSTVSKVFGPDHPEVAHVHWNIALCYQTKGEVDASKRKLGWHNSWPFKFFSAATKKRIVHEGKDFEAMVKHLNHGESLLAFDIFFSLLVVTQTTLLPPVPILSAQCIALIRSQLSTFSSRGSGRITSQPNELHR